MAADGVYYSQFVTRVGNGGLTAHWGGDRWRWESRIFGGAYDAAEACERPVYGALDFRGSSVGGAPRFGSSHFRLTAETLTRATRSGSALPGYRTGTGHPGLQHVSAGPRSPSRTGPPFVTSGTGDRSPSAGSANRGGRPEPVAFPPARCSPAAPASCFPSAIGSVEGVAERVSGDSIRIGQPVHST